MPPDEQKFEWKVLAGRISLFPPANLSSPAGALELYRGVWEAEPDHFHKQANPLLPTVAQAKIGGLTANCTTQLSRIDFNLMPIPPMDMSFALIDDMVELQKNLLRIVTAVGKGVVKDSIARVAIFLHFIALVPSLAHANRLLQESMPAPYRAAITDEEDFVLQINRPRVIADVGNSRMNFITKWSADRFQVFNIALPMAGLPMSGQLGQTPLGLQPSQFFAASVTFDNNSVPGGQLLDAEAQSGLLTEGLKGVTQMLRECGMNVAGF